MQRLLGVEIGTLGVDQLTVDRLFGGINPIARPRLEPDLDRLSQGDVLRGQGPDVGAFGRIRQALDQLLDLTDPVLLDLILERSQPEGELDTPEIRALLSEIQAL